MPRIFIPKKPPHRQAT